MLRLTATRAFAVACLLFLILLIAAWLSGSHAEICDEAKSQHENCPSYNLAAFILIEIAKLLNDYGVALTAVATVAEGVEVAVRNGKMDLYCVGFLHYFDGANNPRTTVFCRQLFLASAMRGRGHFVKVDNPDYEYEDSGKRRPVGRSNAKLPCRSRQFLRSHKQQHYRPQRHEQQPALPSKLPPGNPDASERDSKVDARDDDHVGHFR